MTEKSLCYKYSYQPYTWDSYKRKNSLLNHVIVGFLLQDQNMCTNETHSHLQFTKCCPTALSTFLSSDLVCVLSHVLLSAARQAPLSMEFPRQVHWRRLPFPMSGDLPNSGTKPASLRPPALAGATCEAHQTLTSAKLIQAFEMIFYYFNLNFHDY